MKDKEGFILVVGAFLTRAIQFHVKSRRVVRSGCIDGYGDDYSLTFYVKPFLEIIESIDSERVKILFNTSKITVAVLPESQVDNCYFIKQSKRRQL